MLLPSSGDSFWGEVAAGIEAMASETAYSVLFANAHGSAAREAAMLELFMGKRVDGIIIAGAVGEPRTWLAGHEVHVPVVLVNWDAAFRPEDLQAALSLPPLEMAAAVSAETGARGFSHVAFDDMNGGLTAAKHLLEGGHTRIAFVGGAPIRPALLRILGFRQAVEGAGLRPRAIVACGETLEAGRDAALQVLSEPNPPTAIVAYSDVVAIGAIRAAHSLGIRVPEEISVVGFDDIEVAAFIEPPLTTVRQPKRAMGRQATDCILSQLTGREAPDQMTLSGVLVARGSSGNAQVDHLP
jgi:DNA-binding LacI/PurR family transcriptional regulator